MHVVVMQMVSFSPHSDYGVDESHVWMMVVQHTGIHTETLPADEILDRANETEITERESWPEACIHKSHSDSGTNESQLRARSPSGAY